MPDVMWLIPVVPFASFLLLVFAGRRMHPGVSGTIGTVSVGLSMLLMAWLGIIFLTTTPAGGSYDATYLTWASLGDFHLSFGVHVDALTLTMLFVITFVGFLIHLYSTEYMQGDGDYHLFFAYMNLFVASMIVLVMANTLIFLYLGWEGVGLCSYLLIGFWYRDPANGRAARKAFLVTRIGDVSMLVGIALIAVNLGTLNIQDALSRAGAQWATGSTLAILAGALLLGGAVGKSSQVPLQVWLPDAMAGPTPVSALIHAATMVTAGVYLIARMNVLYTLAPPVQLAVAVIGVVTLLYGGFAGIVQADIKRVLAYSTISQIGYMFLALGVGFWSAAMFHFLAHAFFKALLFLGAGAVILGQHHEQNMFKMGGLRKAMPATFWTFLIGAGALAAIPLVTVGFFSKEWILWGAWQSPYGGQILWMLAGCLGVVLTAVYSFRMVFITFFGKQQMEVSHRPGARIMIPLVILAVLSFGAGYLQTPETLGNIGIFGSFIGGALPPSGLHAGAAAAGPAAAATTAAAAAGASSSGMTAAGSSGVSTEAALQIIVSILTLAGVGLAYWLFRVGIRRRERLVDPPAYRGLRRFLFSGLGFDAAYDFVFVRPFSALARFLRRDFIDYFYRLIGFASVAANTILSAGQSGKVRWYLAGMAFGIVLAVGALVLWGAG